jgi:hypothetical protein
MPRAGVTRDRRAAWCIKAFFKTQALRQKTDFLKRIKLIWPVQSDLRKYFPSPVTQIKSISLAVLSLRGALAIVTNVGAGCGGRGRHA